MKKEVKTATKSGNQLVTLNKLSLSMTIIDFVVLGIMIIGGIMFIIGQKVKGAQILAQTGADIALCGLGIGILSSFLAIGQFVLNKRVAKISDKLTPKTSTIVFAVFFALFLAALIVFGVFVILQNIPEPELIVSSPAKILILGSAGLFLISLIGQAIMSTIVMVKTKVKKAK